MATRLVAAPGPEQRAVLHGSAPSTSTRNCSARGTFNPGRDAGRSRVVLRLRHDVVTQRFAVVAGLYGLRAADYSPGDRRWERSHGGARSAMREVTTQAGQSRRPKEVPMDGATGCREELAKDPAVPE
jgi:hypothetical protein